MNRKMNMHKTTHSLTKPHPAKKISIIIREEIYPKKTDNHVRTLLKESLSDYTVEPNICDNGNDSACHSTTKFSCWKW